MNANAWFYSRSFASAHQFINSSNHHTNTAQPATIPVERFVGGKWVTVMVPNPEVKRG